MSTLSKTPATPANPPAYVHTEEMPGVSYGSEYPPSEYQWSNPTAMVQGVSTRDGKQSKDTISLSPTPWDISTGYRTLVRLGGLPRHFWDRDEGYSNPHVLLRHLIAIKHKVKDDNFFAIVSNEFNRDKLVLKTIQVKKGFRTKNMVEVCQTYVKEEDLAAGRLTVSCRSGLYNQRIFLDPQSLFDSINLVEEIVRTAKVL